MEGSVRKRGNNWYYAYEGPSINGKRKRYERSGGKTKQEALKKLRDALDELDNSGAVIDMTDMSVHDYFKFWFEDYVVRNLKYNTQENYRHTIDLHILPYIGKYKLKLIQPSALQNILNKEYEAGFAKSTVQIIKTVLNSAFKKAVYPYKLIKDSPMFYVEMPRYDHQIKRTKEKLKIFNLNDFKKMIDYIPLSDTFYIPMMVAFHTGLRRGEVCGLTWDNINFTDQTVTVDKNIVGRKKGYIIGTPKTQSSYRTITVGDSLLNILKTHKKRQSENRLFYGKFYNESNFICTKPNGDLVSPNSIKWKCEKIRDELQIDFSFHSFRHTHATMLLENGAKMKDVQERLGHSRISTTMDIYAHVTEKTKKETVIIFEDYLNRDL